MSHAFEIYKRGSSPPVAVKSGFCWPGFFLTWIWAFARGLWLQGALFLLANVPATYLAVVIFGGNPVLCAFLSLAIQLTFGISGNRWRASRLEATGYGYLGTIIASSAPTALAAFAQGGGAATSARRVSTSFLSLPGWFQRLLAIALLTWKAAFRFRLFWVLTVLLLAAVVGLPILIKDDGTARGFTQILLTYTLSVITALLGLCTLWLACGTLARDIEECQMQVVAVKPIARWQIWLGKWLGILSLNFVLLVISGVSVYSLLLWRATQLPADQRAVLHKEVMVARGSAKPPSVETDIGAEAIRRFKERLAQSPVSSADLAEVQKQILEQVKAEYQIVPPNYVKTWQVNLGLHRFFLQGKPLHLRIKFNAAATSTSGTFTGLWQVGVPETTKLWRSNPMSLAPDTFHEFEVPADLLDDNGVLNIAFMNANDTTLLFPLEEGIEVLFQEGGFGLNFVRGLGVIFCWMALLATIGLAAASFLSFPVAAFFSLALLTIALSSSTLTNVVTEGTIMGYNEETGAVGKSVVDPIVVNVFRVLLWLVNLAKDFSPIDALSTGRSVSWGELGRACGQVVVLLGGLFAAFGIYTFSRRELATAQGTQG